MVERARHEREQTPAIEEATEDAAAGERAGALGPDDTEEPERGRRGFLGPPTGYYFYGVVRSRGAWRQRGAEREEIVRVRYRDLEALVKSVPFRLPVMDAEHVQDHQRAVELILRRSTILPAPYGVVFRGRRGVVRFLEDQYLVLDEGLAFLEGHLELRLHIVPAAPGDPPAELEDLAVHAYAELRRFARAAIPFPRDGRRLITAAFLVERNAWIEFINRSDDLSSAHPELIFDVTGPWPPYDFVRMSV